MKQANNRVKLLQKLFAVMEAIPELVKTGQMQEGESKNYAYHEADSIREKFRAELLTQKLLCLPTCVSSERWGNTTSSGGTFNYSAQAITFTFFDVETGESLDCMAVGWGGDSLDKAAPKASIQALKYFLTNGFFVKGSELDGDSPEEQIAGREANRQHQWFEGKPEVMHIDVELSSVVIDGNRLFGISKKIQKQLAKIYKQAEKLMQCGELEVLEHDYPFMKFRTYMGTLNGNGVNPHPIIDKIEILEPATAADEAKHANKA